MITVISEIKNPPNYVENNDEKEAGDFVRSIFASTHRHDLKTTPSIHRFHTGAATVQWTVVHTRSDQQPL